MKRIGIWLALLLLIGAGSSAFAHQEGTAGEGQQDGMMMGPGMMDPSATQQVAGMIKHRGQLGLSPEQVKALEAILVDAERNEAQKRAAIRAIDRDLETMQKAYPVDVAKAEAKVKESEALWTERKLARIKALDKAKAVLTAEQRAKLGSLSVVAGHPGPGMTGQAGPANPCAGGPAHQREGMGPGMMGGGMMEMMHGGIGRGGHHGMMGHGDVAERPLISLMLENREELKLTPEQVQKLETLRSDFRKGAIKRSADLQVAELELEELRKKESVDLAKVEAQVKRIETLRAEQRLSRIKTIEEGKALLSPEQRKKLDTLGQSGGGGHATGGMMGCPMMSGQGMAEMQRFMQSGQAPQAMAAMMEMARRMGDGDMMVGMVRMMEMMGRMGNMMGQMGGMMGPSGGGATK